MYVRKVYDSTLLMVTWLVTVSDRKQSIAPLANSYQGITSGRLVSKAIFDIYIYYALRMHAWMYLWCRPLLYTRSVHFLASLAQCKVRRAVPAVAR